MARMHAEQSGRRTTKEGAPPAISSVRARTPNFMLVVGRHARLCVPSPLCLA